MARGRDALQALPPFQLTFAVPMHCQSCVDELDAAVRSVPGMAKPPLAPSSSTLLAPRRSTPR